MKKSKKEFLAEYSTNPELAARVLAQMGMSFKEVMRHPQDYRDASAGVSGFIYYSDTCRFAKKNMYQIQRSLVQFENECGCLNKPTDDETQYLNWLAWFALENTISEIINYKEY